MIRKSTDRYGSKIAAYNIYELHAPFKLTGAPSFERIQVGARYEYGLMEERAIQTEPEEGHIKLWRLPRLQLVECLAP